MVATHTQRPRNVNVGRAAATGAHAVLVGSALSAASDPAALLRELSAVPRLSAPAVPSDAAGASARARREDAGAHGA